MSNTMLEFPAEDLDEIVWEEPPRRRRAFTLPEPFAELLRANPRRFAVYGEYDSDKKAGSVRNRLKAAISDAYHDQWEVVCSKVDQETWRVYVRYVGSGEAK